jgi:hypothetical protein
MVPIKNKEVSWALVAYACNPSYLGTWDPEDRGSMQARQTLSKTQSQPIAGHIGMPLIPTIQEAKFRGSLLQVSLGKQIHETLY